MSTAKYRQIIDAMVSSCREGQGQLASERVLAGRWINNIDERQEFLNRESLEPHERSQLAQHEFVQSLTETQRAVLASMLESQFANGVFNALVAIDSAEIQPFSEAYEGSSFNDFIGRMTNWPWPE